MDMPKTAMVLAAGLGTRMGPLTATRPKPLIEVAGKALIDHVLDKLAAAGVKTAVVNVHYLADQIERHLKKRKKPKITISDERGLLLDTGGGVVKALALLGDAPFFHVNSDTLWIDGETPNLTRLAQTFDAKAMDALLLLAPAKGSIGYGGSGDFSLHADGRLVARVAGTQAPLVYAGAAVLSPALFDQAPEGAFSLTVLFERAAAKGRLRGLKIDGRWMHVGSPDAIGAAEAAIAAAH
jgi:N-acetyl-alpha-D-muramate 1-phosphate uridylyltransferase